MSTAVKAVVVAHGELAHGLVTAANRIAGSQPGVLTPISNEGMGPDELQSAILEVVGEGPAVVFTDLGAGSCTLAARVSCKGRRGVCVVTGVNLPMLLEFIFHRELELPALISRLEEKAHSGIRVLTTS